MRMGGDGLGDRHAFPSTFRRSDRSGLVASATTGIGDLLPEVVIVDPEDFWQFLLHATALFVRDLDQLAVTWTV